MDLHNLLVTNRIQKDLQDHYIKYLKQKYFDYEIFEPIDDPDFVIFRKKVGESTFGAKPNVFTVDITNDIHIHYTQLYDLM